VRLFWLSGPSGPRAASRIRYADTAALNKIQFNGTGGLRAYIRFMLIGDQPTL
jgi:hypothetical protein